ncbi:hypothetical protein GWK47_024529 [Chionoecetes opilio]|uniref:Uncharacterized protein n=1 Tax=Chionoecetes opilio TaxID=41210 RepID=A0A8J4XPS1_CHIOP|nr:hypothetical protein GWK47_024529 [Chionoecetes opilio]
MSSRGKPAPGKRLCPVVVIWEHNIPKVPELGQASFTLGEWEVTCRRAEREGPDYHYARVGPLDDSTAITEVRRDFRSFDGGEVVEITWIPAHNLPRYTTGKWLRLKVSGTLPTKVSISQLVYWARPTSPSAPLLWVPSDRPLPQHLQVSGAMLQVQRASPMQARRHHLHQALSLFPVRGTTWAQVCALHFQLPGSAALC